MHASKIWIHMDVPWNRGTPTSSILIGFSLINHPLWVPPLTETPIPTQCGRTPLVHHLSTDQSQKRQTLPRTLHSETCAVATPTIDRGDKMSHEKIKPWREPSPTSILWSLIFIKKRKSPGGEICHVEANWVLDQQYSRQRAQCTFGKGILHASLPCSRNGGVTYTKPSILRWYNGIWN